MRCRDGHPHRQRENSDQGGARSDGTRRHSTPGHISNTAQPVGRSIPGWPTAHAGFLKRTMPSTSMRKFDY